MVAWWIAARLSKVSARRQASYCQRYNANGMPPSTRLDLAPGVKASAVIKGKPRRARRLTQAAAARSRAWDRETSRRSGQGRVAHCTRRGCDKADSVATQR